MKKIIPGLLIGLLLGSAATWFGLTRSGPEAPAAPKPDNSPKIEAGSAAAGLPITVAHPAFATLTNELKGYGRVLDPALLVAAAEEIKAARAVADGSKKEFDRTKSLYDGGENATLQAVETAEAAALRDAALLSAARAKLVTAWGRALVERPDFAALVRSLTLGEAALVRVDLLPGDLPEKAPATVKVGTLTSDAATHDAEVLGLAPSADAQAQGAGYLALWRDAPLAPGTALRATIAGGGEPQKVFVVPQGAVVRHEGGVFVYVKTAEGGYERRLVEVVRNVPEGVALAGGVVDENDKVVVTGAQQLLATEVLGALGGGGD